MADSGDSDSDSDIHLYKPQKSNIIESDEESSSSSSDGESDKCPICLTRLGQQDLASPNSCLHTFCLNCLTEWAKNAKTCPIDRLDFKFIIVRSVDGQLLQKIDISLKNEAEKLATNVEDLTYCEVCHLSHREDEMLLCDICDCGYHMDCLNPPIYTVPLEEWYCPQCEAREEQSDNDIDREEVIDLLNDLNDDEQLPRPRQTRIRLQQRLVPRTRASERVRMNTQRLQQNATGGGIVQTASNGRRTKKYSKNKVRVKKRSKKGLKPVRKKNTQLAAKLGMCSTRLSKNPFGDNNSLGTSSNFVDHTSLSIFGNPHEFDYVSIESDEERDIGGGGPLNMSTMSRLRISTTDLISRKEISEILRRPVRRNINISHNTDSINILDTLLNVQEKQFKKKTIENERQNVDKHITQAPMYPDHRTDRNSDNVSNYSSNRNNNRNYSRNSNQSYSNAGNSSSYDESQLTNEPNFSENQPVNPFPFRNSGPIKFRMNVTKMGERKQPRTPPKAVTTEYNVEEESGPSTQIEESFKALEPPPDPPALLLGINLEDDDADNLIIDDKDYYDPENPSDNDEETEIGKQTGTAYMQSPTYGGYMEQVENRSIPHIPISNSHNALRPDDEGISSEEDEKETNDDCPNISLYSSTSLKISNSPKVYGPFLEHEKVKNDKLSGDAELQFIPMPPVSPEIDLLSEHGETSSKSDEDECLESIEVDDDTKLSLPNKDNKCENIDITDEDENKSNSSDDVINVINEIHSDMERESKTSKTLENNQESDIIDLDHDDTIGPINDDIAIDQENINLTGDATSDVSCTTLNSLDTNHQQIEASNLNFDPISDSEEEKKKTKSQIDSCNSSQRNDKLSNGKNEACSASKGNKDKDSKNKVKEKESEKEPVPWKKLSKNSKDRNYRYGKGKEKLVEENDRKEKKQKRKEIELYDVRKVLEDRPRRKKDKFGRDLSKSSHSDSDSIDRSKRKKRKRSRSKQRKRSISSSKPKSRKHSRSRFRSESRGRHRSKSRHRSRSRYRSRSSKYLGKHEKNQGITKERYRSPALYEQREVSPLSKRQIKKSKEKTSIYSKIEKDYERKLLKNDKIAKKKLKKKSKDYQFSSPSPKSLSPVIPVWQTPREHVSPWSHTDISRTPSPTYTRHTADLDMNYTTRDQEFSEYNDNIALNNLTVIVKNDTSKKSKLSKRHTTRQIAVPPVKEVFASGDNILVSVNFNKDATSKQNSQEPLKRKRQETVPILTSKKSKNTNTAAVPDTTSTNQKTSTKRALNSNWVNRKRISRTIEVINAKPVAIIDLNTSPFREIEMSPKSIIVLTDSDEDKQVTKSEAKKDNSPEKSKEIVMVEQQKPVEKNENSTQTISTIMIGGPKTPPEPLTTISKPDNISTNSCEFNSQDEDHTQPHDVRGRGPNTPPEPPRSIDTVVSEAAYDPFEPTKSNSPSPPPRIDMFEDDDHDNHNDTSAQPLEENKTTDSQSSVSPQIVVKPITPPFLESQNSTQSDKSPEKLTTATTNTLLFTSPVAVKTPSPVQPTPTATNPDEIIDLDDNEDSQTSAFDNDADSPYSPGEGFVDEMKGSSPDSPVQAKNVVSTSQNQNKSETRSKLDTLLSILPQSKPTNVFDNIMKIKNIKLKFSSKSKYSIHNTSNEDSVDDLPGSAVELESKNKFLEKLNRQERVIEEVKLVLKPHYNKKHITKEQYKDIMRKAVPKICHNKSGEINPQKIHSLIELYVIKYRHSHRKQVQRIPNK